MKTCTSKKGFTLIELLVVIAIIGLLFAVAMPVFENAGRKNTDRAATRLISTMRLARQHAVNKRQWVIVVFPNEDGPAYTGANGNDIEKCLRSYAVLAVTNSMDGLERPEQIPDNMEFGFISDWKYLPEGIYFDNDYSDGGTAEIGNFLFEYASSSFEYPLNPESPDPASGPSRPMGAVLFKPNGRAYGMFGNTTSGKYWQDRDYSKIYLTSAKYYEKSGDTLSEPKVIPGSNTVIQIRNKTGQTSVWDGRS